MPMGTLQVDAMQGILLRVKPLTLKLNEISQRGFDRIDIFKQLKAIFLVFETQRSVNLIQERDY